MIGNSPDNHHQYHVTRRQSSVTDCQRSIHLTRRRMLTAILVGAGGSLAGCSGPSFSDADVIAGADGRNAFDPAELTVQVDDSVTWGFASAGHNVCCRPDDNDETDLPADAESFASYGPDESPDGSFVPRGETYEHTFEVSGQYDYVCIPHDDLGMTGTVHVE